MKLLSLIGLAWLALASGPTVVRAENSTENARFDALHSDGDSDDDSDDDSDSDRKKGKRRDKQRSRDRGQNGDMCLDRDRNGVCDTTDRTTDRRRDRRDRDDVCVDRDRDGRCDTGVSRGSISDILGSIMRGGQFRAAMSPRMP